MNEMLSEFKDLFISCNNDKIDDLIFEINKLNKVKKLNKTFCYFLLNIMLIGIYKYKKQTMSLYIKILRIFFHCNDVMQDEFIDNLNKLNMTSLKNIEDKNINNALSETHRFFQLFDSTDDIKIGINILHEIILSVTRLYKTVDPNIACRLYVIFIKELMKSIDKENLKGGEIYIRTIEICSVSVKLINEWIKN